MSFVRIALLATALLWSAPLAAADIADYFRLYCARYAAPSAVKPPLDFLNGSAEQALAANAARKVTVDRSNGYLQISDGSRTDQALTMAVYRKADGSELLVAGTSDCADACIYSVQFFVASPAGLQPVAPDTVVPAIAPADFIKAGQQMPKKLAPLVPKINYVPARVGTTLTLTPWYGYETEETMDKATRAAIRNVELAWDRAQGRFGKARSP
jgi:hypothetical protein